MKRPIDDRDAMSEEQPSIWRRFWCNERGAYALEFALCAPIFFGFLFCFVEACYVNYMNAGLQLAVSQAARSLVTGNAQNNTKTTTGSNGSTTDGTATTAADFAANFLCTQPTMPYFLRGPANATCKAKAIIDVRTVHSFVTAGANDSSSFYDNTLQYNLSGPGCVLVLRVAYPLPVIFPIAIGTHVGTVNDAPTASGYNHLLYAVAAFKTEPYTGTNVNNNVVVTQCP